MVEEINASIEQTESQATDRIVDVFTVAEGGVRTEAAHGRPRAQAAQPEAPKGGSIKAIQNRVKQAAKSYLSRGSAALDADWSEF